MNFKSLLPLLGALVFLTGCFPALALSGYDKGGYGDSGFGIDADGDGWPAGEDCDEADANIHPGASEVCDGADNDCDGDVDEGVITTYYSDDDGDGYGDSDSYPIMACEPPLEYSVADNGDDCDDTDVDVNPDAMEICDGVDNNCDGEEDEGLSQTWYVDTDADGFGDEDNSLEACTQPMGYVSQDTDCDDGDANVSPSSVEICDEIDNDCDGLVDDDDVGGATGNVDPTTYSTWYADMDGDGYGNYLYWENACAAPTGYVANQTDCDDTDISINPGEAEVCGDGIDNDCYSGNDTTGSIWCADDDGDSYGDSADCYSSCAEPAGRVIDDTDCDDTDADVYPGATEVCNSVDDDCNGTVDDGATDATDYYVDTDGDGYGNATSSVESCSAPTGYVLDDTDCDDTRSGVNLGAYEYCSTSYDDDCDGSINETSAVDVTTWYADTDSDGYGNAAVSADACTAPTGYVSVSGDCDDSDGSVGPGSAETCNGVDDDCDGYVDNDATDADTWYADLDGDGFGDPSDSLLDCDEPTGYVADNTDCNDDDGDVNPDGPAELDFVLDPLSSDYLTEVNYCSDGLDNDCDGDADSADWNCDDYDGDGIENGADPYIAFDYDADGNEDLCAIAENLYEPDWTGSMVYVQEFSAPTSLSTSSGVTLSSIIIDGVTVDAWCVEASGSGYAYGLFISSLGTDGSSSVDTSDCSDWVRPVAEVCNTYADGHCASSGNTDGCDTVGNTGWGYYYSSGTMSPY